MCEHIPRNNPDSKVHGANMGPSWADRTQVGPMLALWTLPSGQQGFSETLELRIRHIIRGFERVNDTDKICTFVYKGWYRKIEIERLTFNEITVQTKGISNGIFSLRDVSNSVLVPIVIHHMLQSYFPGTDQILILLKTVQRCAVNMYSYTWYGHANLQTMVCLKHHYRLA